MVDTHTRNRTDSRVLGSKRDKFCATLFEFVGKQKDSLIDDVCKVKEGTGGFTIEDIECDMNKLQEKQKLISDIKKNIDIGVAICGWKY